MPPKSEPDIPRLRNQKAVIIQNTEDYPIDKRFLTYESFVEYLDKELELYAEEIFYRESFENLQRTMRLVNNLCEYIFITQNYLDNLRSKNILKKGSYLDRMLQEVVIEEQSK